MNTAGEPMMTTQQHNISLSASAIEKVRKELAKQPHVAGLRLAVKKSGCSGYMYNISVAEQLGPEDKVYHIAPGVTVVIDTGSLPFVMGMELDFVKQGLNENFRFNNPNAQSLCGCGESFTVKQV